MKCLLKVVCLLVSVIMMVTIVGCGTSADTTPSTTATGTSSATSANEKDDTIYDMTYFQAISYNTSVKEFSPKDTKYLAWIRDKFGVSITAIEFKDAYEKELQLMWASGNLPDIFTIPVNGGAEMFTSLVEAGELKDLGKYYKDAERWPNLNATLPIYQSFGVRNGVQYCYFGGESKSPDAYDGEYSSWLMIPKKYYEQFGINIKTYDDFKKYCQAVLDSGLKSENGGTVYPYGGHTTIIQYLFQQMYGLDAAATNSPVMTSEGKWVPMWATNEMYSALKSMNECWRLGYFDPETFTQDNNTLNSKIYNAQIAMFSGSYGEADAFIQKGNKLENNDDKQAWNDTWSLQVVTKVAGNDKALGVNSYTVFPSYRTVLNAKVSDGAADKFSDFVEWRHTEEGMFSDYYQGWPGETWKYNENGKAIPYYSWWPNKDPSTDWATDNDEAQQAPTTGNYWQVYNRFQDMLNPATVRLVSEKGSLRKNNLWWNWLRGYTVPAINNAGYANLSTPVNAITYTQDASTISADMSTVYGNWFGKIVTSSTEKDFQANYEKMISELSALDVETFSKDIAQGWSDALASNPDLASLKFPKNATALDTVAGLLK